MSLSKDRGICADGWSDALTQVGALASLLQLTPSAPRKGWRSARRGIAPFGEAAVGRLAKPCCWA